jgi:hypothetical protein
MEEKIKESKVNAVRDLCVNEFDLLGENLKNGPNLIMIKISKNKYVCLTPFDAKKILELRKFDLYVLPNVQIYIDEEFKNLIDQNFNSMEIIPTDRVKELGYEGDARKVAKVYSVKPVRRCEILGDDCNENDMFEDVKEEEIQEVVLSEEMKAFIQKQKKEREERLDRQLDQIQENKMQELKEYEYADVYNQDDDTREFEPNTVYMYRGNEWNFIMEENDIVIKSKKCEFLPYKLRLKIPIDENQDVIAVKFFTPKLKTTPRIIEVICDGKSIPFSLNFENVRNMNSCILYDSECISITIDDCYIKLVSCSTRLDKLDIQNLSDIGLIKVPFIKELTFTNYNDNMNFKYLPRNIEELMFYSCEFDIPEIKNIPPCKKLVFVKCDMNSIELPENLVKLIVNTCSLTKIVNFPNSLKICNILHCPNLVQVPLVVPVGMEQLVCVKCPSLKNRPPQMKEGMNLAGKRVSRVTRHSG